MQIYSSCQVLSNINHVCQLDFKAELTEGNLDVDTYCLVYIVLLPDFYLYVILPENSH